MHFSLKTRSHFKTSFIKYEYVLNSDFSYLAFKCFNLTSKNLLKSRTCPSISLSVQYLMQSHNWIDFGHFFPHFFCKLLTRHITKKNDNWQHVKLFWPPQLKNLKYVMLWPQLLRSISCHTLNFWGLRQTMHIKSLS